MWERLSLPIGYNVRERPSTPSALMALPVRLSPRTGLLFFKPSFPGRLPGPIRCGGAALTVSLPCPVKLPQGLAQRGHAAVRLDRGGCEKPRTNAVFLG